MGKGRYFSFDELYLCFTKPKLARRLIKDKSQEALDHWIELGPKYKRRYKLINKVRGLYLSGIKPKVLKAKYQKRHKLDIPRLVRNIIYVSDSYAIELSKMKTRKQKSAT